MTHFVLLLYEYIKIWNTRKIATFRTGFPCRRHSRYFNFATVGNQQKTVACHPKRCGIL